MFQFEIHTFGCKVNTYDSGLLGQRLKKETCWNSSALVHIINSCAVTAEATKEVGRLARKIRAQNPLAVVVATGCAAQVDSEILMEVPGIDLVIANSHKGQISSILNQYFKNKQNFPRLHKSNIFKKEDLEAGGGLEPRHKRAFLKIQDGCNSFCSFCIIPYARGLSRSIGIAELVNRINDLYSQGFIEVVLTGVHIGDYQDGEYNLEDLIEAILTKTKIKRIRLSSLEPIEISDRLLEFFSEERICPHFHLSIQSANSEILTQMKRRYDKQDVRNALNKIYSRVPNAFVGMDVIAGFPTETDEQFLDTYKTLDESPWTRLHVFPFSERRGTRAATLKQIPYVVRKARAARLRELSLSRYHEIAIKQKGTVKSALIIGAPGKIQAVTRDYWSVRFDEGSSSRLESKINEEVGVQIIDYLPNLGKNIEGYLQGVYP